MTLFIYQQVVPGPFGNGRGEEMDWWAYQSDRYQALYQHGSRQGVAKAYFVF